MIQINIPYSPPTRKTHPKTTTIGKPKPQHLNNPKSSAIKFNLGGNPALNESATAVKVIIANLIVGRPLTKKSIRVLNVEPRDVATLNRIGLANPCPTSIASKAESLLNEPNAKIGTHTPICIILLKAIMDFKSASFVPE